MRKTLATLLLLATTAQAVDVILYATTAPTMTGCGIPKTGQTTSFAVGDDGDLKAGRAWPVPRFSIVGADGTAETNQVRDNLTGLIVTREWNFIPGGTNWLQAIHYITNTLNVAGYGGATDWRLPNRREFETLLCYQYDSPPLADSAGTGGWVFGDPFFITETAGNYWTSTTRIVSPTLAIYVNMSTATFALGSKAAGMYYFFAVRGGSL